MGTGFRYITIRRPPMVGGLPRGVEVLNSTVYDEPLPTINGTAWGEVVLARKLTAKEARDYELVLSKCKWKSLDGQEICSNGDCPACADVCPLYFEDNYFDICKYRE